MANILCSDNEIKLNSANLKLIANFFLNGINERLSSIVFAALQGAREELERILNKRDGSSVENLPLSIEKSFGFFCITEGARIAVEIEDTKLDLGEVGEKSYYNALLFSYLLQLLNDTLGGDSQNVIDPDNPRTTLLVENKLRLASFTKGSNNRTILSKTLFTIASASNTESKLKEFKDYNLNINNSKLYPLIQDSYSSSNFNELFQVLKDKGVFNVQTHPKLGVSITSGVSQDENFEMGARFWITDICHNLKLLEDINPKVCPIALKTIASFYYDNMRSIEYFINNPISNNQSNPCHPINMIREGKLEEAKLLGVPHIFISKEVNSKILIKADKDFNRWRQESHGNALLALVKGIRSGVLENKNFGLSKNNIDTVVTCTISALVSYFDAIDYPYAPSGGNWEERPYEFGLTYDTAVISYAIGEVKKLMIDLNQSNQSDCREVYNSLVHSKYGEILKNIDKLDSLLEKGRARVRKNYNEEAPKEYSKNYRKVDASQIFTVCIASFDNDLIIDAKKKIQVLEAIECELAGEFGIARYVDDSYLACDYDTAIDNKGKLNLGYYHIKKAFGSKDCSTKELLEARAEICGGKKALWFFDSVMARAYNKIAKGLLESGFDLNHDLVKLAFFRETKFLNRAIARVTGVKENGDLYLKSNGYSCPPWSVPEAYQAVTNLTEEGVKSTYVVGRNSPLAWAQTELYLACKLFNSRFL